VLDNPALPVMERSMMSKTTEATTEKANGLRTELRTLGCKEIEALAHGESIPRFVAVIDKVWEQKTGVGEYGNWYLQNINVIVDGRKTVVTWTGEDPFEDGSEGHAYEFCCSQNKQGKLVGVCRDIRQAKDGKVYKGIKVTPYAKIRELDDAEAGKEETVSGGDDPREVPAKAPDRATSASDADQIEDYAKQAVRVFHVAWNEANELAGWMVGKEARAKMSGFEYADLQLRIAQNLAIEINKMIRKERF